MSIRKFNWSVGHERSRFQYEAILEFNDMLILLFFHMALVVIPLFVAEVVFRCVWPRRSLATSALVVKSAVRALIVSLTFFSAGYSGTFIPFTIGLFTGLKGAALAWSIGIWGLVFLVVLLIALAARKNKKHSAGGGLPLGKEMGAADLLGRLVVAEERMVVSELRSSSVSRAFLVSGGVAIFLSATMIAKSNMSTSNGSANDDSDFSSSVVAMDHDPSDTFVGKVFVNGEWIGEASSGGGMVSSGISLPGEWYPGLTAVVAWERCEPYGKNCRRSEKVVPIHPYEHVGHTDLHLLADDQVLIIPTVLDPEHPDYPGPGYPAKDFFRRKADE